MRASHENTHSGLRGREGSTLTRLGHASIFRVSSNAPSFREKTKSVRFCFSRPRFVILGLASIWLSCQRFGYEYADVIDLDAVIATGGTGSVGGSAGQGGAAGSTGLGGTAASGGAGGLGTGGLGIGGLGTDPVVTADAGADEWSGVDAGVVTAVDAGPVVDSGTVPPAASCTDLVRNADETDVDCGGATCAPCSLGGSCDFDSECETAECTGNVCLGWPYRRPVVVGAGSVAANLTDFPLLVSVSSDAQLAAGVAVAGGLDIRFTAADGITVLDHEIESYNNATGQLWAWVKVPQVATATPTTLYLEYGNPGAADQQNALGVWSAGYTSVWHMSDDPGSGGADEIVDSTGISPGTAHASMTPSDLVVGQVGGAIDFDGNDDEIRFTNTFVGGGSHTISGWIEQRVSTGRDAILAFGADSTNFSRALFSVFDNGPVAGGFYFNDFFTSTDLRPRGWTYVTWTYDGADSRIYINGSQSPADPVQVFAHPQPANTIGTNGWLGNVFLPAPASGFGPDQHLNGRLDEVRVYAGLRDANWIQAEFDNQSLPAQFAVMGVEQLRSNPL